MWVSLNDGSGGFSTPEFVPNDSSGQGQFGYGQEWRVEKHVRTLAKLVAPFVVTKGFKTTASGAAKTVFTPTQAAATKSPVTPIGVGSGVLRKPGPAIVGFGDAGVWTALGTADGGFQTARIVGL